MDVNWKYVLTLKLGINNQQYYVVRTASLLIGSINLALLSLIVPALNYVEENILILFWLAQLHG